MYLRWTAQCILAAGLLWASATKLFTPPEKLAAMWPWTADYPLLVKITAIADLLTGLGLVLPGLLRIYPHLTVYAALGTLALMLAAVVFHIARGEVSQTGLNVFFALLAVFVAWSYGQKAPGSGSNEP